MKLIEGALYLHWKDLIESGISENTIKSALFNKYSGWEFIKDGADKRRSLVFFDTLSKKYQELIKENLCRGLEPSNYYKIHELKRLIISSQRDREIILNYKLPSGKSLTQSEISKYIRAADYCNFLSIINSKQIKALGFAKAESFYETIISLIKSEKLPLPLTYSNLKKKVKAYKIDGPTILISKKLGKANNCKISKDDQEAYLRYLYRYHGQLRFTQIVFHYNKQAEIEGWPKVTDRTVSNHIKVFKHHLSGARFGIQEFRNANDYVIGRARPSKPNLLWVGDATPFELYYQAKETDSQGRTKRTFTKRLCVYFVIDAHNDYIVGFSFGETETNKLAINAWSSACITHNVLPYQVKTDNYGKKELGSFFEKIALNADYFTPSAIGNARDKVIESVFAKLYDSIVRYFPNASGRNIKAKEQPNRDMLEKIKHDFPNLEGVQKQIMACITEWNTGTAFRATGISREEQRRIADHSEVRQLDDIQRLKLFGRLHTECTQTNNGIITVLGGQKRKYMLFTDSFYDMIGTTYNIFYDPYDYSKILVKTKDERTQFILEESSRIPMAFKDMKEGDRLKLNTALNFKERQFQRAIELMSKDDQILLDAGHNNIDDPEALLKARFSYNGDQKQLLHEAENSYKQLPIKEVKTRNKKQSNKTLSPTNEYTTIYSEALNDQTPKILNP